MKLPISADAEGVPSVFDLVEVELEERWRKVFHLQGLDLDKGDLCIISDTLKGVVRIPKRFKESIVVSKHARPGEVVFVDRSTLREPPSIDMIKFMKPKEEGVK